MTFLQSLGLVCNRSEVYLAVFRLCLPGMRARSIHSHFGPNASLRGWLSCKQCCMSQHNICKTKGMDGSPAGDQGGVETAQGENQTTGQVRHQECCYEGICTQITLPPRVQKFSSQERPDAAWSGARQPLPLPATASKTLGWQWIDSQQVLEMKCYHVYWLFESFSPYDQFAFCCQG